VNRFFLGALLCFIIYIAFAKANTNIPYKSDMAQFSSRVEVSGDPTLLGDMNMGMPGMNMNMNMGMNMGPGMSAHVSVAVIAK
jgi:hypothetical protein